MHNLINNIREELRSSIDMKTLNGSQHFFKEEIVCYGVKVPVVRKISQKYFKQAQSLSKHELFNLCDQLWQSGYLEESFIACFWSYQVHPFYQPDDFARFKIWIERYVNNWASCDTLCNHTVGTLLEMYPDLITDLKELAGSSNRWMRRAVAVSLIVSVRKGLFLDEVTEIAGLLLKDDDDLVQKGYGWLLKVASQTDEMMVFNFVMQHKAVMPRTALRYAIEKMPKDLKALAMAR